MKSDRDFPSENCVLSDNRANGCSFQKCPDYLPLELDAERQSDPPRRIEVNMTRFTERDENGGINCWDLTAALNKLADREDAEERMWAPVFPSKSGYIDRKKLLVILDNGILNDPECPLHIAATVNQEIAFAPAADVAPVIHAYWIPLHEGVNWEGSFDMRRCSNCGKRSLMHRTGEPYCSQCGAKMDAKEPSDEE